MCDHVCVFSLQDVCITSLDSLMFIVLSQATPWSSASATAPFLRSQTRRSPRTPGEDRRRTEEDHEMFEYLGENMVKPGENMVKPNNPLVNFSHLPSFHQWPVAVIFHVQTDP